MVPFKSLKEAIKYLETIFENKKYITDIWNRVVTDSHLSYIGDGITRVVFQFKVNKKDYVVKFNFNDHSAICDCFGDEKLIDADFNLIEYKFWQKIQKFPIIKKLLCPIIHFHKIQSHSFLIMPKAIRATIDNTDGNSKYDLIRQHFSDNHMGNFGYLNNKLVIIDYAYPSTDFSKNDLEDTTLALKDAGI